MSNKPRRDLLYKALVVGDIGAGKTSLIKRYIHNIFSAHYKSTIGVDFGLKVIQWDENTTIRMQLWDIAGQERFGNMTRVYYKDAVAAFVVFDITRSTTFDAVIKWKADIDSKICLNNDDEDHIPVMLLANKIDLYDGVKDEDKTWNKTDEEMTAYCKEKGFLGWFAVSAKDGRNIEIAANALVNAILEKIPLNDAHDESNNIKLTPVPMPNPDPIPNDNCCN